MSAARAAQQQRWQAWYDSDNELPWDTHRPGSQLVAYLTGCGGGWTQHRHPAAQLAPAAASRATADLWLPPPTQQVAPAPPAAAAPRAALHLCPSCSGTKPPAGSAVLEIGCGTGSSSVWLAQQGYQVVAVDLVAAAVTATRAAAAAAGCADSCAAIQMDVFELPLTLDFAAAVQLQAQQVAAASATQGPCAAAPAAARGPPDPPREAPHGAFSLIYDSQTFHVLRDVDEPGLVRRLAALLAPEGLLFLLAGNASEPRAAALGPPALTEEQLLRGLMDDAGLQLRQLAHTRFDETGYYRNVMQRRPLAWCALLQKPAGTG